MDKINTRISELEAAQEQLKMTFTANAGAIQELKKLLEEPSEPTPAVAE